MKVWRIDLEETVDPKIKEIRDSITVAYIQFIRRTDPDSFRELLRLIKEAAAP